MAEGNLRGALGHFGDSDRILGGGVLAASTDNTRRSRMLAVLLELGVPDWIPYFRRAEELAEVVNRRFPREDADWIPLRDRILDRDLSELRVLLQLLRSAPAVPSSEGGGLLASRRPDPLEPGARAELESAKRRALRGSFLELAGNPHLDPGTRFGLMRLFFDWEEDRDLLPKVAPDPNWKVLPVRGNLIRMARVEMPDREDEAFLIDLDEFPSLFRWNRSIPNLYEAFFESLAREDRSRLSPPLIPLGADPPTPGRTSLRGATVRNWRGYSLFAAARICNWLSEETGREPCYEVDPEDRELRYFPGRSGFRLPTAEEWEFACLSHAESDWWFGWDSRVSRLFMANSDGAEDLGYLYPNDTDHMRNEFGLNQTHGNFQEWTMTRIDEIGRRRNPEPGRPHVIRATDLCVMKGGALNYRMDGTRAKASHLQSASSSETLSGFRLVLPAD